MLTKSCDGLLSSSNLCARFPQEGSATLFITLLAAFKALVFRLTGQRDVVVGSPIANRHHAGLEGLIGLFVNSLALRTDVGAGSRFSRLFARVRETAVSAYAHQDLPFEKLVEHLELDRDPRRGPLFQVLFTVEEAVPSQLELGEAKLTLLDTEAHTTRFDLEIQVLEGSRSLLWTCDYDRVLFERTTIRRLAGYYLRLLQSAVEDPERSVSELALLSTAERHQLDQEWNDTVAACPQILFTEAFEAWAHRTPDAVALGRGAKRVSYAELDRRSGRLAGRLRRLGIGPDVIVGMGAEHRVETIVALLAVFKAGGACLPLDPNLPRRRLERILEDAQPSLVPELSDVSGASDVSDVSDVLEGDALAYVIYTSGSTGRPKGVQVHHHGLAHLVETHRRAFGLGRHSRVLALAPLTFDAAFSEVGMALLSGATLLLKPEETLLAGTELLELLRREAVTVATFAPALLATLPEARLASLETVICGGEALPAELAKTWAAGRRLFNAYGPTEVTVDATGGRLHSDGQQPSIGRPIANTAVRLLDRSLRRVPIGAAAELCVAGPGLARGYLRRPAATAERFVPDPHTGDPCLAAGRLYRTGDLARHLSDGRLDFLGRLDKQVKVRGFRVEPGEVEAALRRHPNVADAAVLLRDEDGHGPRLAAFVATTTTEPPGEDALRSYLRARLPDYMVPAFLVFLPALPRTPNDKLDRAALARVPWPTDQPESETPVPASGLERKIAGVWREVLGLQHVDVERNFFDLGGHSLALVRIQEKLRDAVGLDVPLVELFHYPSVRTLARYLSRQEARPAPLIEAVPETPSGAVAVIGMAGRFPGASGVDELWRRLRGGEEPITFFTDEELRDAGVDSAQLEDPSYVKARGVLRNADLFDAEYFGFTPLEAEITPPDHRLFLECTAEALESAGYGAGGGSRVGVFGGVGSNSYLWHHLRSRPDLVDEVGAFRLAMWAERDHLTTRVSYKAEPHRAECQRADGVLHVTGGCPHGLPELAPGRVRRRRGRRGHRHGAAECWLHPPGR